MNHIYGIAPLVITTAILTGCGSSSNDTPDKPKADYSFTQAKKDEILAERKPIVNSISLHINQQQFTNLKFVHSEQNFTLYELTDSNHDSITLMLVDGSKDNSSCIVYRANAQVETFNCAKEKFNDNGDSSILQKEPTNLMNVVTIEYQNELLEVGDSLGSTRLTLQSNDHNIEIVTSFAFDNFYRDIFCGGVCEDKTYSTLGVSTYLSLESILEDNALSSATLVFNNPIGGSADDEINLYTGLLIRDSNLGTKVTKTGSVFSGGTDLFAAGVTRTLEISGDKNTIESNQQIGVHSWSNGEKSAKDSPYSHEMHRMQATYTTKMLGAKGVDFYLFTLDAAPAEGAHYMTKAELEKYSLVTQFIE